MQPDDFSTLFDLLPIGAYRSSPDGRQLRANPALVRIDGYNSEKEMLGATKDLAQEWYVDPSRREQFKALLATHGRVQDFVSEVYRHKTRERIWVRVHAHVVRAADGAVRYFEGTVEDITQQHRIQLALQASERRFRALAEKAQLLTLIYAADGLLSYASPSAKSLLGVDPSAMLQSHLLDWIHPDEVSEARREMAHILHFENSGTESVQRFRHADGNWRFIALLANNCVADEAVQGVVVTGRDVTESHLAQQQLIESEARFRSLTEMSSDWYWESDDQFRFTRLEAGPRVAHTLRGNAVMGKTRRELGHSNLNEADWDAHFAVLRSHKPFRDFEFQITSGEDQQHWHSISGEPVFDQAGVFRGHRGVGRDVTELKRAEETIKGMAFQDELTGLANRRLLMDRLQQVLASSARKPKLAALMFLDLDRFKQLNDSHGHDAGDQMLVQVAQRLCASVRAIDTVSRVGGDEFVVLLQDLGDSVTQAREQAQKVGQKILSNLSAPYVIGLDSHQGGCSIGAVVLDDPALSAEAWLKKVDTAMYQAKAQGRNMLRFL
jgi:diguanylate cyclase (GGDEF)-like protein/PAS domain S-box-containing protein